MIDPLSSAKAVFRRAQKHITDLESAIDGFKTGKPYTLLTEYDPGIGKHIFKAKFNTDYAEDVSCIMFDAIQNLRASLDQMTDAIAHRHRGASNHFAQFPFAKDAAHWPNRINGLKNDLPEEIRALFSCFQPYKGGNDMLWAMHYMVNIKKHSSLIPVGFGAGASLTFPYGKPDREFVTTSESLRRKNEIPIFYMLPDDPEPKVQFSSYVVIDDPEEIIQGKQPGSLLQIMGGYVLNVFNFTEAKCRGIGMW